MNSSLHIVIGAAPTSDATLAHEIRLLKPALLYGDQVTLVSPKISLVAGILDVAKLDSDSLFKLIVDVAPLIAPDDATTLATGYVEYRKSKSKKGKSRDEIIRIHQLEQGIQNVLQTQLAPALDQLADESGATELSRAIDEGLLEVAPLLSQKTSPSLNHLYGEGSSEFSDEIIEMFVERIRSLLEHSGAYPLFDDRTGQLVASGIEEGLFDLSKGSQDRARQVSAAALFMDRLPAFENATIQELLDIRSELREPLVRFRAAMVTLGETINAQPHESEFHDEVEAIYFKEIAPALLEIQERVRDNAYLRRLVGAVAPQLGKIAGGMLTIAMAKSLDLPQLIAGVPSDPLAQAIAFAGGASALTPVASAVIEQAWQKVSRTQEIERHEMYFLYRTGILLD